MVVNDSSCASSRKKNSNYRNAKQKGKFKGWSKKSKEKGKSFLCRKKIHWKKNHPEFLKK